MSDVPAPQQPPDSFDIVIVQLHRMAILGISIILITAAIVQTWGDVVTRPLGLRGVRPVWWVLMVAIALLVSTMHLYSRRLRLTIHLTAWSGILLILMSSQTGPAEKVIFGAGLGCMFAVVSIFAVVEQKCFEFPAMQLVPVLLCVSLVPMLTGNSTLAGPPIGLAGLLCLIMAISKIRRPHRVDIGRRANYEI